MAELQLVRVREDGEQLVLADGHGTEHVLAVTDALRAAVARRPQRQHAAAAPEPSTTGLSPRVLQARMRAGASAEELAAEAGVDVEHVRRFEHPVVAEREHVVGLVRAHLVQGLDGASELGTIADARLAARGVPADEATWSARREGTAPWVVEVRFAAGDRERSARWTFDLRGRVVTPLDDEARWLGQPDDPLTPELRGVPSLSARRGPATLDDDTTLLLDDLAGRRGHRPGTRPFPPPAPDADAGRPAPAHAPRADRASSAAGDADGGPARPREHDGPDRTAPDADPADGPEADHPGASVVDLGRWNPRRRQEARSAHPSAHSAAHPAVRAAAAAERAAEERAAEEHAAGTPDALGDRDTADRDVTTGRRTAPERPVPERPAPERPAAPAAAHEDDGVAAEVAGPATGATPVAAGARPATSARGVPATRRSRKGRPQVPSWDEIVFGARPES
jgi:hypothetical protein